MARKLKVEVDLETDKAKAKMRDLAAGSEQGSISGSGAVAPRAADNLAEATKINTRQMMQMTRAFSGMALGLAASYSARYFDQGSTTEKALGYIGSGFSGASAGAMMGAAGGPIGMAVGGVLGAGIGIGKEYLDRDKLIADKTREYQDAEENYQDAKEFADYMKDMTSSRSGLSSIDRLNSMYEYSNRLDKAIKEAKSIIEEALADGMIEIATEAEKELAKYRGKRETIQNAIDKLEESFGENGRPSMAATDALMKLGGGFGLPQANRGEVSVQLLTTNRLLEDIRTNTTKKGSEWL